MAKTKIDVDKLIKLVKQRPELYDEDSDVYHDPEKRQKAWKEISRVLDHPAKQCQQKWSSLRSVYNAYLRQLSKNPNSKWHHVEKMKFLDSYLRRNRKLVDETLKTPATKSKKKTTSKSTTKSTKSKTSKKITNVDEDDDVEFGGYDEEFDFYDEDDFKVVDDEEDEDFEKPKTKPKSTKESKSQKRTRESSVTRSMTKSRESAKISKKSSVSPIAIKSTPSPSKSISSRLTKTTNYYYSTGGQADGPSSSANIDNQQQSSTSYLRRPALLSQRFSSILSTSPLSLSPLSTSPGRWWSSSTLSWLTKQREQMQKFEDKKKENFEDSVEDEDDYEDEELEDEDELEPMAKRQRMLTNEDVQLMTMEDLKVHGLLFGLIASISAIVFYWPSHLLRLILRK